MATHSSVPAWRIPGTGEPWWAAVSGVAQSQTRLKQLSSSRPYQKKSVTVNIFMKEKLQVSQYENGDSKEDEGFVKI